MATTTSIVPLGAKPRSASSPWWHSTETPAEAAAAAEVGDALRVGIEGDGLGAGLGERDGVAGDPELDDPPATGDVAEQVQLVVARHARAVGHVHGCQCAAVGGAAGGSGRSGAVPDGGAG